MKRFFPTLSFSPRLFLGVVFLAVGAVVLIIGSPTASAQSYPNPLPQQFLLNGAIKEYTFTKTSISLKVNANTGYISSRGLTSASFARETINPHSFNYSQPMNVTWRMSDPGLVDNIDSCSLTFSGVDPSTKSVNEVSSLGDPSKGDTSGSETFASQLYSPGNYLFKLACVLDGGETILNDFVYVYLIPNAVSPSPKPFTTTGPGYSNSGVRSWMYINDNRGYVSSRGLTSAEFNTENMNPLGFSGNAPFVISVSVTGYSSWLAQEGGSQSNYIAQVSGGTGINGCSVRVSSISASGGQTTITTLPVPAAAGLNAPVFLPMTLMSGNYLFYLNCDLSNGNKIGDLLYVYIVGAITSGGGAPPPPPPGGGGGGGTPPPAPDPNQNPIGSHDESSCTVGARGWARDPDAGDTPIEVHIYVDGAADGVRPPVAALTANEYRSDPGWPYSSRNHGFTWDLPGVLVDGRDHRIYVYAINLDDDGEKNGTNPHLAGSPRTINCPAPVPPPQPPSGPRVDLRVRKI